MSFKYKLNKKGQPYNTKTGRFIKKKEWKKILTRRSREYRRVRISKMSRGAGVGRVSASRGLVFDVGPPLGFPVLVDGVLVDRTRHDFFERVKRLVIKALGGRFAPKKASFALAYRLEVNGGEFWDKTPVLNYYGRGGGFSLKEAVKEMVDSIMFLVKGSPVDDVVLDELRCWAYVFA